MRAAVAENALPLRSPVTRTAPLTRSAVRSLVSSNNSAPRSCASRVPPATPPAGPAPTTITSKSVRVATALTVLERGGALLYTTLLQVGALRLASLAQGTRLADRENGRRPRASRLAASRVGTGEHGNA